MTATHQGRRSLDIKQEQKSRNWKRLQMEAGATEASKSQAHKDGCLVVPKGRDERLSALKLGGRLW